MTFLKSVDCLTNRYFVLGMFFLTARKVGKSVENSYTLFRLQNNNCFIRGRFILRNFKMAIGENRLLGNLYKIISSYYKCRLRCIRIMSLKQLQKRIHVEHRYVCVLNAVFKIHSRRRTCSEFWQWRFDWHRICFFRLLRVITKIIYSFQVKFVFFF